MSFFEIGSRFGTVNFGLFGIGHRDSAAEPYFRGRIRFQKFVSVRAAEKQFGFRLWVFDFPLRPLRTMLALLEIYDDNPLTGIIGSGFIEGISRSS